MEATFVKFTDKTTADKLPAPTQSSLDPGPDCTCSPSSASRKWPDTFGDVRPNDGDERLPDSVWTVEEQDPSAGQAALLDDEKEGIDWLVPAVLSAIFCFPPTGIIAVVLAAKARIAVSHGDGSHGHHRRRARTFVLLTLLLGIVLYGVLVALIQSVTKEDTES